MAITTGGLTVTKLRPIRNHHLATTKLFKPI